MTYIARLRRAFRSLLDTRAAAHLLRREMLTGRIQEIQLIYGKYGKEIRLLGADESDESWFAFNSLGFLGNGLSRFGYCPAYLGEGDVFYLTTGTTTTKVSLERAIRYCRILGGIRVTEAVEKDYTSYTFTAKAA